MATGSAEINRNIAATISSSIAASNRSWYRPACCSKSGNAAVSGGKQIVYGAIPFVSEIPVNVILICLFPKIVTRLPQQMT